MKYLLMTIFFSMSRSVFADQCIDARWEPFEIVQKLDAHHYEIRREGELGSKSLVLITKNAEFFRQGHLIGIGIRSAGSMRIQTKEGFEEVLAIKKECALLPKPQDRQFEEQYSKACKKQGVVCSLDGRNTLE